MDFQDSVCAERIRAVLSEKLVNAVGRETGFCRRLRKFTPLLASWSFVVALASGTTRTLSDVKRVFTSLSGMPLEYKPFHDRLSHRGFPKFLQRLLEQLWAELVAPVLVSRKGKLKDFEDIWIQDGTSFALNDKLKKDFPGRFTKISPAAVEVHGTYSVFTGQTVRVAVAPDCQGERDFLPEPWELRNKLGLFDRGYVSYEYFDDVRQAGGHLICRARDKKCNPTILRCYRGLAGNRQIEGKKLADVRLSKSNVDLLIQTKVRGQSASIRLVLYYDSKQDRHIYFYTTLCPHKFSPNTVATIYRLRWQVELFFKDCKSYTNLKKFQTANRFIAEGLIWATMIAVIIRRYLLYSALESRGQRSAPFVAGALSWQFFLDLGRAAATNYRGLRGVVRSILQLLAANAQRTNPQRRTPFEVLEITPVYGSP